MKHSKLSNSEPLKQNNQYKFNNHEKKRDAGQLSRKAELLGKECEELQNRLRAVMTHNNELIRMLENSVWEKDMVVEEFVDLTMSTDEFLTLLGPLLRCGKWTVNDRHNLKPFLRAFLSVFRLRTAHGKGYLTPGTVENLIRNYLDQFR